MLKKCIVIFIALLVVCSSVIPILTLQNIANAATLLSPLTLSSRDNRQIGVSTTPISTTVRQSQIAFASYRDGNAAIYVMNADGTGQTCLTNNSFNDSFPSWSPDGSKIAFMPFDENSATAAIYVMNADGTGQTRLTNNSASWWVSDLMFLPSCYLSWSPDSSKISFTSVTSDWDPNDPNSSLATAIYVMNADGTGQTCLTNNSLISGSPSWSPDGSKIAFTSMDSDYSTAVIYVMNADGTGQTCLTNNSLISGSPSWSPDGSKIAFTSMDSDYGTAVIYVMNADGTGQTCLTDDSFNSAWLSWSPDGSKIAFMSDRTGLYYEIYVMNTDGTGQTCLTDDSFNSLSPSWSPDGSKIAFMSDREDGNNEIYVMNADGTGQTCLTDDSFNSAWPSWSPALTSMPTSTPISTPTLTPTPTSSASPTPNATPIASYGNGTVAASGGIVSTIDGNISISFPSGAFNASTNVTIQGSACQGNTSGFVIGDTCFDVTPDGELDASATICVNLSAYDFSIVENKADLTLGYWANGSWNVADNVTISGTTICGKTAHLSDWAVLGTAVNTTPTPSTSPTPIITSQPTATPSPTKGGGTNWALIGGIVGGVLLLVALVVAVSIRSRGGKGAKRNRKPKQRPGNKQKKSTDDWQGW